MKGMMILVAFLFVGLLGCKESVTSTAEFQSGVFDYSAYDAAGGLSTSGTLTLSRNDSQVTGSWQFNNGQSGRLVGKFLSDSIALDLNPGWMDNNLILEGRLSGKTYSGKWTFYGYAPLGRGTFVANMR